MPVAMRDANDDGLRLPFLDVEHGVVSSEDDKDAAPNAQLHRNAHSMSARSLLLRRKSGPKVASGVRCVMLRTLLQNLQEVVLGTKLYVLFAAVPLAIAAQFHSYNRPTVFALSLVGLVPLAERVSFLTE
uniref:Uncharacterized protein n=1 Tax=Kalanchoe fedtschenkoi TaxID=63787 RepID=A0A7N0UK97_KALFE